LTWTFFGPFSFTFSELFSSSPSSFFVVGVRLIFLLEFLILFFVGVLIVFGVLIVVGILIVFGVLIVVGVLIPSSSNFIEE
jgi:hypothetical protein